IPPRNKRHVRIFVHMDTLGVGSSTRPPCAARIALCRTWVTIASSTPRSACRLSALLSSKGFLLDRTLRAFLPTILAVRSCRDATTCCLVATSADACHRHMWAHWRGPCVCCDLAGYRRDRGA